jgi:hypothetical protein
MDCQDVGAHGSELFNIIVRILYHEMHVKRRSRNGFYCRNDRRAECYVGNKMAVHNVKVKHVRASLLDGPYFITQFRKIGGENRWRYL